MKDSIEVITVYRGKDSATYLASDVEKYGIDNADPIKVNQYPGENVSFVKIKTWDIDGWYKHGEPTKQGMQKLIEEDKGGWDKATLEELLKKKG